MLRPSPEHSPESSVSEETRSPDEPEKPSGSDPQSSPEVNAPGEAASAPSEEVKADPAPASAADPEAAIAVSADAPAEAPAASPEGEPTAATPESVAVTGAGESAAAEAPVAEPAAGPVAPSEGPAAAPAAAQGETPTIAVPEPATEADGAEPATETDPAAAASGEGPVEPSITTPEEAEAFVRSVRAAVPTTLPEVLEKGQLVRGVVKDIEDEDVVLDVSEGRFEARLPKLDFVDASGKVSLAQGDRIDLVLEEVAEPPVFKRHSSPIGEAIGKIAQAFASHEPIEGAITSSIKGGFEVKLEGLRAFLPGSQATLRRSDDKSKLVGQTLPLMVTKFDPSGRSIVVSRRKILEKQRKQEARQTRENLKKGAKFSGRVVALQAYGAFIDIGGIQGLLHLTEISWSRLRKPDDALKVGQRVDVQVLEHDESGKKVSLSMRALMEDPWKAAFPDLKPNQVVQAKILRIVKSGAIVELAPGVEARLAPSELAPDGNITPEGKKALVGKELPVQVVDFDAQRHRAALLVAPEGSEIGSIIEPPEVKAGAKIKGIVERAAPFGLFVRLAPGKLGLLHATESNTPPGTELGKEFPPGTPLQVEILEVNEEEDRIRLTRRTVFDRMKDRERQAARAGRGGPRRDGGGGGRGDRRGPRSSGPLVNPAQAPKGGGFASFGDILKSAIGKTAEAAPPADEPAAPPAESPSAQPEPSVQDSTAGAEPSTKAPTEAPTPEASASAEASAEAATAGGESPETPAAAPPEPPTEPPASA